MDKRWLDFGALDLIVKVKQGPRMMEIGLALPHLKKE